MKYEHPMNYPEGRVSDVEYRANGYTTTFYAPMNTTAFEAKDIAETDRRPLRILHTTVTALDISRQCLDNSLILRCHLHHGGQATRAFRVFLPSLLVVIVERCPGILVFLARKPVMTEARTPKGHYQ